MITNTELRREEHKQGDEVISVFVQSKLIDSTSDALHSWEHWLVPHELKEYLALGTKAKRSAYLDRLIARLADVQRAQWTNEGS